MDSVPSTHSGASCCGPQAEDTNHLLAAIKCEPFVDRYVNWDDSVFLRTCLIRCEHGDATAWTEFLTYVTARPKLICAFCGFLKDGTYLQWDRHCQPIIPSTGLAPRDIETLKELADALRFPDRPAWEAPIPSPDVATRKAKTEIMYIESKLDLTGPGRIGRVQFSKTGKTIYYDGRAFQSLSGRGDKSNYFDVETGEEYWISGCRKDGQDTLYPGVVQIDEDVREEYWRCIRERPEMIKHISFRSQGKHRKRNFGIKKSS